MNAPAERKVLEAAIPAELLRHQPAAKFALFDDGQLMIAVGNKTLTLTPDDIRRLDRFMGAMGGAQ